MHRTILLARKSFLLKNIPIGSIIINNDFEIGIGFNYSNLYFFTTNHGEIIALAQASFYVSNKFLTGSVIYITLEPCFLCLSSIIISRINNIIFSAYHTNNLKKIYKNKNKYKYIGGVLEKESVTLLNDFFLFKRY